MSILLPLFASIFTLLRVRNNGALLAFSKAVVSLLCSSILSILIICLTFTQKDVSGRPHNPGIGVVFVPLIFMVVICMIVITFTTIVFAIYRNAKWRNSI